jgi:Tfp pilus assembly protein PilN
MEPSALNEATLRLAGREMPIPLEDMYLSWQAYPAEKDEWQVLVIGISRQPIDALLRMLSEAGIKPSFLDIPHLSLARLAAQKNAIIVDFEPEHSNIVMLAEGVPLGMHIVPSLGPEANRQDEVRQIADKLTKMVDFYNNTHPKNPVQETIKVLLTGELSHDASVVELIQEEITHPVELLTPADYVPSDLPLHEYAVNAGSMLMNAVTDKDMGRNAAPYRNINLGEIAKDWHNGKKRITVKKLLVPVALAVGIGALITAYQFQNHVQASMMQLQTDMTQANLELNQLLESVEHANQLEEHISEIEANIQEIKYENQNIPSSNDFVRDTSSIVQAMPAGLSFNSIEVDTNQIIVLGSTDKPSPVVQFANNLETSGGFSEANVIWIDRPHNAGSNTGLTFMIIISR